MTLVTQQLSYRDERARLTGELVRDDAEPNVRPGILLVHGGAGLDDHAREQARRYAALGYVVLAADMFGEGVAGDREQVMANLIALRDDPERLTRRTLAGLAALSATPHTDGRAAAIGFCFGGMAVLALARAGTEVSGVISIHGSLATTRPAQPGTLAARVLVCHGARDPHVPAADVDRFVEEMNHAGADWQLIMYGGAEHGFTHKHAIPGAVPGVAYHASSDKRSFAAAQAFLGELFADGGA